MNHDVDDATVAAFEEAVAKMPDNVAILMALVRARLQRGEEKLAADIMRGRDLHRLTKDDRATVSHVFYLAGDAESALAAARGDAPVLLVARARALLALARKGEARDAYQRAVAASSSVADADLAAQLEDEPAPAAPPDVAPLAGERPRLRVIEGGEKSDDDVDVLLAPARARVAFADVGGLDDVKRQLRRRVVTPFVKPSLFRRFGKRVGGGILLYGPPGCGKTLLARATAGECNATFFNVALSDVLDMWLGESEAKLHALFAKARASAPAVLFFDEIEALGGKRQYSRDSSIARLVSQFLSEMDGFEQSNDGVLVLGATNLPWAVDGAFMRTGRFDRFLFVPPPDREAREVILRLQLRDRPVEGDADSTDVATLARRTAGYSGADLKGLVETAADLAIEESLAAGHDVPIRPDHLKSALGEVRATTVEWLTTARNHARYANEGGQYDDVLEFLRRHGNP